MANSHDTLIANMHLLLSCIDAGDDLPELNQDLMFALDACVQKEYVAGVKTATMASGKIVADISSPRLTPDGLEYLYPNQNSENETEPHKRNIVSCCNKAVKIFFQILAALASVTAIISFFIGRA